MFAVFNTFTFCYYNYSTHLNQNFVTHNIGSTPKLVGLEQGLKQKFQEKAIPTRPTSRSKYTCYIFPVFKYIITNTSE